jgi:hypothetical protein
VTASTPLPNGSLDPALGSGGIVTTGVTVDVFGAADRALCVAIQPDGTIVVGGFARNGTVTGLALVQIVP